MRLLRVIPLLFLCLNFLQASAQNDNCGNAILLCAPNPAPGSTITATFNATDPALPCGDGVVNNSVWYTVVGVSSGTATVTLTGIDNNPGLAISAYTGTCGALAPIGGAACNAANGPGGSTSITFPTTAGTTYYIMVDNEAGNPGETFTIAATTPDNGIMSRPTPTFDAIPFVTCVPDSITLQNTTLVNGPTTYQWRLSSTGPLVPSSGADTTIYFGTAGAYDISLVATNSCGSRTQIQTIYIQDLVPAIVYSPLVTCIGQPVSFTGSASIQPQSIPPTILNVTGWLWNFGDPLSGANNTSTLQNPTHTFVGTPPFTVTLTVDGTCGPDVTTMVVTLLPPPVVTATAGSPACQLAPVALNSVVDSNGTAPISYLWSGPGTITNDTLQNTTATGLPPGGPYVFTITITDANGCTASDTASVFINPLPIANAGNDTTVCHDSPVPLNGIASGGTPPYTYAWTPGTGLSDSTIANPVATVPTTTTYCLVVTDSFGCVSAPDCMDLNIYPPPTLSLPATLCATDPQLTSVTVSVNGAGAGSTYNWTQVPPCAVPNVVGNVQSQVFDLSGCGAGSYTFSVTVTDGVTGCVDIITASYSITPGLTMTLSPADTICAGSSSALTATGATTYAWTASPPYVFADSTLASQTVSPAVTTTFTVLGTTGTCSQTLSTTVTVNPLPVAVAAPIPPFCGCATVSLNGTGSTPGMVYQWSSAGGNTILSPTSLVTSSDICTSDVFTLTVTDPTTGCSATITTAANATAKPNAAAAVTPDTICNNISTLVNLDGTGSATNPGIIYNWTSSPAVPITDTTALITTATVTTSTTFTLTVTDTTTGCDSVVTTSVMIYPPHVLNGSPGALCTTDPLLQDTITISGAGPGSTYNWTVVPPCASPNVVGNVQSQIFDLSGCGAGNFTFTVIVTDAVTGCIDTVSTTVPIVTGVTLTTSPDTTICNGDVALLTASGALTYAWTASPPYPFADSTQANQNVSPSATTTFSVIGTTGVCSDMVNITVTVNPIPPLPTINGPTNVCEGDTGTMYTTSGGAGSTFSWTVGGGTLAGGQGNDTITVNWGSAGGGTVTVVDTNSFGCPGPPAVLNVTINPLPNTSPITGSDTMCVGDSAFYSVTNVAGSTYTWSVVGGTYTGSGSTINVTWTTPGTDTVTVVETNAVGCSDTAVVLSVVVNPVPVTPPITGPTTVCVGTIGSVYSIVPPTGTSTYTWSGVTPNGNITSGQGTGSITVDWIVAGPATITVTETNSSGCPGLPVTLNVTVNAQPTASPTAANDSICVGDPLSFTGNAANGTISWTTSGSGTFSNPTTANPTYTASPSDTPQVTLTIMVSNPPCAPAVATVQITVVPLPTPAITGPDTVCAGTSGVAYFTTNYPGSFYTWSVTGGSVATGNGTSTITVDWGASGSGTVTVIEYNFFGCPDTTTLNVVINPSPVPISISSADTILCVNSTGTYSVVPITAGSTYTWNASGGTVLSPGSSSTNINWTVPGNQTVIVTETNSFGCPGVSDTLNVLVNPRPAAPVINGPDTVCENEAVVYYVNNVPGSTHIWNIMGGTITSFTIDTAISVTWGVPPGGTVSVFETNSNGCRSDTTVLNVVINPVPGTLSIIGNNPVCENDSGDVYALTPVNPTSSYAWTIGGNGTIATTNGVDSITVNWGAPGEDTITVVETNSLGCSTNNILLVNINAQPVANATAVPDTICANVTTTLNGTANAGTVLWQTSGTGTFGNDTVAVTTYTPGPADSGSTTLTMILSNPPCANDTAFVNITVIPAPIVTVTSSNSPANTVCFGDSITLIATGGGTYSWNPGGATTDSIIVSPPDTATYTVQVMNTYNCTSTASILVSVIQLGTAIAGNDMVICNNDSAALNGFVLYAGGGVWSTLGDGTFIPDSTILAATYAPGPADIAAGTVTLVLTTTGSQCTNLSDTMLITLDSFITVNAGPDQTVYRNQTATINGSITGTPGGWWTTTGSGTFVPDSTSLSATYQPSQGDYNSGFIYLHLHAVNACGPVDDSLRLDFPDIIVPNVFTPGTDNFNNYFEIRGLPAHSRLQVFNRWGQVVFKADNYRNNWDAAELNDDTYYYILNTPPPESRNYHGNVRVIREKK